MFDIDKAYCEMTEDKIKFNQPLPDKLKKIHKSNHQADKLQTPK